MTRAEKQQLLAKFGEWCLEATRHDGGSDIDGGSLQDEASREEKH